MSFADESGRWAHKFGLALAPMFEHEGAPPGCHSVLLDGAYGTFAMSVGQEELWRSERPADWIWSSDIPHHVTVTASKVAVLRWDKPDEARVFDRQSIERNLERFYGFLTEDRLRSNRGVVEHLLGLFRRLRSLGHAANLPDTRATDLFTGALARLITGELAPSPEVFGLAEDADQLLGAIDQRGLSAALDEVAQGAGALAMLQLHPALAVRHAGGQLFQEAHFELLRGASDFDLFGLIGKSEVAVTNRGGTHFTPATLARSLIERAFADLADPVHQRPALTICDPACGSGVFLHEALRALRRANFVGRLNLIGYDVSPAAIAMARFAITAARRDWEPNGGLEVDLRVADSLGDMGVPSADVIVMNPPFIGFAAQTVQQRQQLTEALGATSAGRGDYSMAFVLRALKALKPGGVLGTLFPASLLSLKAAASWRDRLLDLADLRFLGSIGDYGLFSHALVQVAAAVFSKERRPGQELVALITENDPQATSAALRELRRRTDGGGQASVLEEKWSLFPVPVSALKERPTWRLPTPRAERILEKLSQSGLPTVADLFDVAQGIQTGLNSVFLLTPEEISRLPAKERYYFRRATMTDSIQNGRIVKPYWVFFPHSEVGALFSDEHAVRQALPRYFHLYLEPNRNKLASRATILQSQRSDWWGLMRAREWSLRSRPRIITKFFGAEGAFVADCEASFFAVMGHVWTPKTRVEAGDPDDDASADQLDPCEVLNAFVGLCNSTLFVKLLALYSPHVAGGQFDLSARHVAPIPVPDLQQMASHPVNGRVVRQLAALGRTVDLAKADWIRSASEAAAYLYGGIDLDDL